QVPVHRQLQVPDESAGMDMPQDRRYESNGLREGLNGDSLRAAPAAVALRLLLLCHDPSLRAPGREDPFRSRAAIFAGRALVLASAAVVWAAMAPGVRE